MLLVRELTSPPILVIVLNTFINANALGGAVIEVEIEEKVVIRMLFVAESPSIIVPGPAINRRLLFRTGVESVVLYEKIEAPPLISIREKSVAWIKNSPVVAVEYKIPSPLRNLNIELVVAIVEQSSVTIADAKVDANCIVI